jgi:hypothetical protein
LTNVEITIVQNHGCNAKTAGEIVAETQGAFIRYCIEGSARGKCGMWETCRHGSAPGESSFSCRRLQGRRAATRYRGITPRGRRPPP